MYFKPNDVVVHVRNGPSSDYKLLILAHSEEHGYLYLVLYSPYQTNYPIGSIGKAQTLQGFTVTKY